MRVSSCTSHRHGFINLYVYVLGIQFLKIVFVQNTDAGIQKRGLHVMIITLFLKSWLQNKIRLQLWVFKISLLLIAHTRGLPAP